MNEITIGSLVKTYRTDQRLSKRQLAEKASISHTEISRIENGERTNPSIPVLYAIANTLNIPSDVLLEVAGWGKPSTLLKSIGHFTVICYTCKQKQGEILLHNKAKVTMICECGNHCSIYPTEVKECH